MATGLVYLRVEKKDRLVCTILVFREFGTDEGLIAGAIFRSVQLLTDAPTNHSVVMVDRTVTASITEDIVTTELIAAQMINDPEKAVTIKTSKCNFPVQFE
jgi:hypothetical protein